MATIIHNQPHHHHHQATTTSTSIMEQGRRPRLNRVSSSPSSSRRCHHGHGGRRSRGNRGGSTTTERFRRWQSTSSSMNSTVRNSRLNMSHGLIGRCFRDMYGIWWGINARPALAVFTPGESMRDRAQRADTLGTMGYVIPVTSDFLSRLCTQALNIHQLETLIGHATTNFLMSNVHNLLIT